MWTVARALHSLSNVRRTRPIEHSGPDCESELISPTREKAACAVTLWPRLHCLLLLERTSKLYESELRPSL